MTTTTTTTTSNYHHSSPTASKKRKITEEPDFKKVLLECGVLSITGDSDPSSKSGSWIDANVSSLTLRASLNGLLQEMHNHGIDVDHLLTIQSMQDLILNGGVVDTDNDGKSSIDLFKMLLPMKIIQSPSNDCLENGNESTNKNNINEDDDIIINHNSNMLNNHTESSLMKTLLKVEALQPALLSCLLQKLQEIATSDLDPLKLDSAQEFQLAEDIRRLILSHIRWMEFIVDPSSFMESIMECIGTLPSCFTEPSVHNHGSGHIDPAAKSILLDLMSILPDIIDDHTVSQKPNLVEDIISTLREVRNAHPSLLITCLDTISSVRFTTMDQMKMVIEDALEALETVTETWLLPSICKFLLQNTPRGDASLNGKVVDTLRRLKLGYDYRTTSSFGQNGNNNSNKQSRFQIHGKTDSEALMLEYIAQGMTYRSDLMTSLTHAIKCAIPSQHTATDIWLLFCCGNAPHYKTKINALFKSKAQSGGFTADLISDAIHGNGIALQFLLESSMMPLADTLLRSNDSYSRDLGCSLYEELYLEFIDRSQRQDIIGQIVIHISSGSFEEMDGAFRILRNIISRPDGGPSSLRLYLPFFTSLLDNILNFEATHVRSLFLILFLVQGKRNDESSSGGDEVLNCIRKNLAYYQNLKHMHIAIIGAVSFATAMCKSEDPEVEADIFDTLVLVHRSCSTTFGTVATNYLPGATAMSLFLDELGFAIQSRALSPSIKKWIIQSFSSTLEEYLGDIKVDPSVEDGLSQIGTQNIINGIDKSLVDGTSNLSKAPKGEIRFNIDKEEALVYLRLLTMVCTKEYMIPQLCPLLRLLAVVHDERFGGQGISEIDAVLGCPILLPDLPSCSLEFTHLTDEQKLITTTCLFFAVSWCREIVNTFVFVAAFGSKIKTSQLTFDQDEARPKILKKLRCLLELEDELVICARKCHNFVPPGTISIPTLPKSTDHVHDDETEEDEMDEDDHLRMTDEEKRSFNKIKKLSKKKDSEKVRSKQKALRLKSKHEDVLESNVKSALFPMSPHACLALGFPELKDSGHLQSADKESRLFVCDDVSIRLLKVLLETLENRIEKRSVDMIFLNFEQNPYSMCDEGVKKHQQVRSSICDYMDTLIDGNVFVSIHERLIAASEIFGNVSHDLDIDSTKKMICCLRLIFQLTMTLIEFSFLLFSQRRTYLAAILRQIACGDIIASGTLHTNQVVPNVLAPTKVLFDLFEEVFESCKQKDFDFSIIFVNCLESLITNISRELDDAKESALKVVKRMKYKLSEACLNLLRYEWPNGTNVSKRHITSLLGVYLQYSDQSTDDGSPAVDSRIDFGRTKAINTLINDAVMKLPLSDRCKGPVHGFPTCSRSTFGSFFMSVLSAITAEANSLFSPGHLKQLKPSSILHVLHLLVSFINQTFKLTKENAVLAKSTYLLMQLRCGTKFMDAVVKRGLPFFSSIFNEHQNEILSILRDLQRVTRQMMFIVHHGKISKDGNLVREGPKVRKVYETFIHKVKVVLKKSGVEDAFMLGELKLKAIDGTVLKDDNSSDEDHSIQNSVSNTESEEEVDEDD